MSEPFKATAATPYPDGTYPITELYLFPEYQTREEFKKATGEDAPPFNETQPVKNWRDIGALKKRTVLYKFLVSDSMGNLSVGSEELLSGAYAASVNMLPDDFTGLTEAEKKNGSEKFPVPVRDLLPTEEILIDFGGIPKIRDRSKATVKQPGGGFEHEDRKLLLSIRSEQVAQSERLTRIEDFLKGFTIPSPK